VITVNEVAPPPPKTEKQVADGYLIKLSSPAVAYCGDKEYSSSLTIGERGKILFENVALANNCHVFVVVVVVDDVVVFVVVVVVAVLAKSAYSKYRRFFLIFLSE